MKTSLWMAGLLTLSLNAVAGEKGNGGGAHVCRDLNGKIISIKMYDLYEGRSERYNFQGETLSGETVDEVLDKAYSRVYDFGDSFSAKIQAAQTLLMKNIAVTKKTLLPTIDANKVMVDPGCGYEQVAIWDDRVSKVFINEELFEALEVNQKAALYFHESVYFIARSYSQQTDSDDTREFVARVFLNEILETKIAKGYTQSGLSTYKVREDYRDFQFSADRINWSKAECYEYNMSGKDGSNREVILTFSKEPTDSGKRKKNSPRLGFESFDEESNLLKKVSLPYSGEAQTLTTFDKIYRLSSGGTNNFKAEIRSPYCNEMMEKSGSMAWGWHQFHLDI